MWMHIFAPDGEWEVECWRPCNWAWILEKRDATRPDWEVCRVTCDWIRALRSERDWSRSSHSVRSSESRVGATSKSCSELSLELRKNMVLEERDEYGGKERAIGLSMTFFFCRIADGSRRGLEARVSPSETRVRGREKEFKSQMVSAFRIGIFGFGNGKSGGGTLSLALSNQQFFILIKKV